MRRTVTMLGMAVATSALLSACSDLIGNNQQLPAGTPNPSSFNTLQGALGMRRAALHQFALALQRYSIDAGLLTDELSDASTIEGAASAGVGVVYDPLDERVLTEDAPNVTLIGRESYQDLQAARGAASQAIGALAAYGASVPPAVRGGLYALQGYTALLLADLFCSGVPLSTLDFQGDYTYHPSSTTREVYAAAIAKFDTALTLAGDSMRVRNLALVGKGRALLALDSVGTAAQIVHDVPDAFRDTIGLNWSAGSGYNVLNNVATVSDSEGGTGVAYRTGGDPRTAVTVGRQDNAGRPFYFPTKYVAGISTGFAPFLIASGIEARLIEAEAALRGQEYSTWIGILNTLRQTAMVAGQVGTLDMLADPGPSSRDSARVALQFRERAAWLFIDGHRQGDLRRLVRNYQWSQSEVYPSGAYLGIGSSRYGSDVNAPIPAGERPNPLFHGCLDRNA